jgi:hypothetical protein
VLRITGLLAPVLAAAALLTGCSPADARKAQDILTQAQQSSQAITSESFLMKMTVAAGDKSAEIDMQGGAYMHGPQAGDVYIEMTGSVPDSSQGIDLTMVKRGGTVTIRSNGQTQTLSASAAAQQYGSSISGVTQLMDLARYVKGGSVSETDYQGRPADKLVGILDTQGLVSSTGGVSSSVLGQLGVHLGDVRVVLYVPRDTHLVEAMLANLDLSAGGQSASMAMSLAVTGVNKPLTFPTL